MALALALSVACMETIQHPRRPFGILQQRCTWVHRGRIRELIVNAAKVRQVDALYPTESRQRGTVGELITKDNAAIVRMSGVRGLVRAALLS